MGQSQNSSWMRVVKEIERADAAGSCDAGIIADALTRGVSGGALFVLRGFTNQQMLREAPALRAALNKQGLSLFVIDPMSASAENRTFLDLLANYVRLAELRGVLSEAARELFTLITSASEQTGSGFFPAIGGQLYNDTLSRLWSALCEDMPAVLLVLNAGRLPPAELNALEHLARYFLADPLAQLMPETRDESSGAGRLLLLDEPTPLRDRLADISSVLVDLSARAESSVREFFADPAVIRRFVESTGGDPQRLSELVESLPADIRNFWAYRYQFLPELEQVLVSILAVASQPLAVDLLHSAAGLMRASEYFARSLRGLSEQGFVTRSMGSGVVTIQLSDLMLADSVLQLLDAPQRQARHRALAEAAISRADIEAHSLFLARHFLAAGEAGAGLKYGRKAVKKLMNRRRHDEAERLLLTLLEHANAAPERQELLEYLVDVYVGVGQARRALRHLEALRALTQDPAARLRLRCQAADLLIDVGEFERAIKYFDEVADKADKSADNPLNAELWLEARLGRAEAFFSLGEHQKTEGAVSGVLEWLGGEDEGAKEARPEAGVRDLARIQARNLRGKIALLSAEYAQARELFEDNRALSLQWGWDDDAARAEANLGLVALQSRDFSRAIAHLEHAQQMARSPATLKRARLLLNLGVVHQRQGQLQKALEDYKQGVRVARQEGDEAGYALALYNVVTLYQDMGAFERAHELLAHLEEQKTQHIAAHFVGELPQIAQASLLIDQQRYPEALSALRALKDAASLSSAGYLPARELRLRAVEGHLALGQRKAAEQLLAEGVLSDEEMSAHPQLAALRALAIGGLALDAGDYQAALDACQGAVELARGAGHRRDALRICALSARALIAAERPAEARALLERELEYLRRQAEAVPELYRASFFRVPTHQDLVNLLRDLNGDIPAGFIADGQAESERQAPTMSADRGERAGEKVSNVEDPAFLRWRSRYKEIVGEAPRLHQLFRVLDRVAASDSPVLLLGESGTGKELMAEAVHSHSERADAPFVKVNCAAFVENLLLSELFGHVKGAFTGASVDKVGRFELADGGTIFLDEIGDVSAKTQVALLRVLQEGCFEKVGSAETQKVNVRVVCATNKQLDEMVERGEFRLDLYYRLKGVVLEMPPLRERRQDIVRLARYFARKFSKTSRAPEFSAQALQFLSAYNWPGNIRELQNFVRSVLLFVEGDTVEMSHIQDFGDFFADGEIDLDLPEVDFTLDLPDYDEVAEPYEDPEQALVERIINEGLSLASIKARLELVSIRRALIESEGNITRAAKLLQMKRPRLSQIVNASEDLVALRNELVS